MSEMIKCGWRACQQQIEAITDSGAQRQYCSDRHKVKASAARTRKARAGTTAFRHMRVKQASGFAFAKMMEAAERVAAMHGYDPDVIKDEMVGAISRQIEIYRDKADA
jgi:hypothetical protein